MLSEIGCVGIVAKNSIDFVAEVFACQARAEAIVPLRSVDDSYRIQSAGVTRVVEVGDSTGWAAFGYQPFRSERIGQVLMTSGTTGDPKPVALTESSIACTTERLNQVMEVTSEIREYIGVPVYYSFGLGRVRAVSQAGGEFFIPSNGFNPAEIADMLARGEINAISAVPTLWRVLLQNADLIEEHGKRIRWIEIGSQSMSRAEKEQLKKLFPCAIIVQHYGLTEASRTTFLSIHREQGDVLESVGTAEPPIEVRTDTGGRILIRGPHTGSYSMSDGRLTALLDDDGWLVTNDLGELRDGYLYFRGRADDVINCGGIKLFPEVMERELLQLLHLSAGIAIARAEDTLRGDGILVVATPAVEISEAELHSAAVAVAKRHGLQAGGAIRVGRVESIPVTATGKVQRNALAKLVTSASPNVTAASHSLTRSAVSADDEKNGRALTKTSEAAAFVNKTSKSASQPSSVAPSTTGNIHSRSEVEQTLLSIWKAVLGVEDIAVDESFFDVGGDSLTAVSVALRMEKAGLERRIIRGIFQGETIAQLAERLVPEAPSTATIATPQSIEPALPTATNETQQADVGHEPSELERELLEIWRQALGISDIKTTDSFYDVGGDSLTAIAVTLNMARAGLDKRLARGVLHGKTVAELAALHESTQPRTSVRTGSTPPTFQVDTPQPPAISTSAVLGLTSRQQADLTEAFNFLRGIVILCIVSSHWMPVYFSEYHFLRPYGYYLRPLFSLGSPTLAVVFGISVAVFYSRQYARSTASFHRNVRIGVGMLAFGTAAYAGIEYVARAVHGESLAPVRILPMLCGPLLYYLLAMASMPLWIRWIRNEKEQIVRLLYVAGAFYFGYLLLRKYTPHSSANPVTEAVILMIAGKWGLLQMGALSCVGMVIALTIERRLRHNPNLSQFFHPGLMLILGGILLAMAADQVRIAFVFPKHTDLWSIVSYCGVVVSVVAWHGAFWPRAQRITWLRTLVHLVCTLGIALFPLYVAQSIVYHSSDIVRTLLGFSHSQALTLCIGVFLALTFYPLRKIYHLYYA